MCPCMRLCSFSLLPSSFSFMTVSSHLSLNAELPPEAYGIGAKGAAATDKVRRAAQCCPRDCRPANLASAAVVALVLMRPPLCSSVGICSHQFACVS